MVRARTLSGFYPQGAYNPAMGEIVEYDPEIGSWLSKAIRAVAPAVSTVLPSSRAVLETAFPGSTVGTPSWNPDVTLPTVDPSTRDAKQSVNSETPRGAPTAKAAASEAASQWIKGVPNGVTIAAGVIGAAVLFKMLKD
jgi:hypothetical protein